MQHPLVEKLDSLRITKAEDLAGETIAIVHEVNGIYFAMQSGKWAFLQSDGSEEYTEDVYVVSGHTDWSDIHCLGAMGYLTDEEKQEWQRHLDEWREQSDAKQIESKQKELRALIWMYPDAAKAMVAELAQ